MITSFALPFSLVGLLTVCSYLTYRLGFSSGHEQGMSDAYSLYIVARPIGKPPPCEDDRHVSARIAIGSTLFAMAASAFLFLLPQQPVDTSLHGEFRRWQGVAYVIVVKYPLRHLRDAKLYEDDKLLGPANSDPQEIWVKGGGLYKLYKEADETVPVLMFSSSDNTDPNTNGRTYRLE